MKTKTTTSIVYFISLFSLTLSLPLTFDSSQLPHSKLYSSFDSIVAFGDSFTDDGNGAYSISNQTWPLDQYYHNGRFSNGLIWVETLAYKLLSLNLTDYAVGGSTTNNTLLQGFTGPSSSIPVPSTLDQVTSYLNSDSFDKSKAARTLYVVGGGGNDAFFGKGNDNVTPFSTVTALAASVELLKAQGGTTFLIPNLPPFGSRYPFTTLTPSYASYLTTFAEGIKKELDILAKNDCSIRIVNTYDLFLKLQSNAEKYGFDESKLNESCVQGVYGEVGSNITVCDDPRSAFWWDEFHPNKRVHAFLAREAHKTLTR